MYNFQSPQKFSGNHLYNPYQNSSADWQKTNFHAHALAWRGITNGKQTEQTVLNAYKQKGYAFACISNYDKIAKEDKQANSIDVYEHGCNIYKTHQLVIMPKKVYYHDFPFFQFTSSKQFIINKLGLNTKAVVLAHPGIKDGYDDYDLKKLSGYNLIEALNHSNNATKKWDVALSAGKSAWIIADDDTHDISDLRKTFVSWTMIDCHQPNKDSLVKNLIEGNAYGVTGKNAFNDNQLLYVKAEGMHISVQLKNNADSIKFIGDNGTERITFFNTAKGNYTFLDGDTYIRTVVFNKLSTMYLNPVVRYDGIAKPQNNLTATVNMPLTVLYRFSLIVCWLILLMLFNVYGTKYLIEYLLYNLRRGKNKISFNVEHSDINYN